MDLISAALRASAAPSFGTVPLVVVAGVATSVGPCAASRFLMACTFRSPVALTCFVVGIVFGYGMLGEFARGLWWVARASHVLYWAFAGFFLVGAFQTLVRPLRPCCDAMNVRGNALLLGAASAFTSAPCCAPIIVAIVSYGSQGANAMGAWLLACAFGVAHVTPLLIAGRTLSHVAMRASRAGLQDVCRITTGGLMVALSAYYGCLA